MKANAIKRKPQGKENVTEEVLVKFKEPVTVFDFFYKLLLSMDCTQLAGILNSTDGGIIHRPYSSSVGLGYLAMGGKFKGKNYDQESVSLCAEFKVPGNEYKPKNPNTHKADKISLSSLVLPNGSIINGLNKIIADDKSPYKIVETKDTLYNSVR